MDLAVAAGRHLSADELEIAEYVLTYYVLKYSGNIPNISLAAALAYMDDQSYEIALKTAADVAQNPVARGLLRLGKTGEKILKALIVTAQNFATSSKSYINKNADEYNRRLEIPRMHQ